MAVLKILELVGTSKQSWSDAAREAVNEAAKTVRGIETVEVAESQAVVPNHKLTEYQVVGRLGFRIEGTGSPTPCQTASRATDRLLRAILAAGAPADGSP